MNFGFYEECLYKYGNTNVWKHITNLFDYLQLAAVVDNRVMCVHGGISPSISQLDGINQIERKQEIPIDGGMTDIMWSDPDEDCEGWGVSPRGAGYIFGKTAVERFNQENSIDLICRAHQLVMEGYREIFDGRLVTVWSAPNYSYRCGNVASILEFDENLNKYYKIFTWAPRQAGYKDSEKKKEFAPDYFL